MYTITGKIKTISEVQKISETFRKREFVLTEASGPYPQHISLQLTQDSVDLIAGCEVGDEIKVSFNLRGREWKTPDGTLKYFNSLDAWKIEKIGTAASVAAPLPTAKDAPVPDEEDDLPF